MKDFLHVFLLGFLPLFSCPDALAHKVGVYAYVEGGQLKVESYFYGGKACRQCLILVFGNEGSDSLLEGKTDQEGKFSLPMDSFPIEKKSTLKFVVDAGSGHRGEYLLEVGKGTLEQSGAGKEISEENFIFSVFPRAVLGVVIIFLVAMIFGHFRKRGSEGESSAP